LDVNGEVRAFVVETVEAPDSIGTTAGKSDRNVGTPARTCQLKDIAGRLKHMDALDINIQILHNSLWLYSLTTDLDAEAVLTFVWPRWLAATWAKSNGRLPWSCLVPTLMPDEVIRQIRCQPACAKTKAINLATASLAAGSSGLLAAKVCG
jgi:hypothetical protein